jgi:hypothetical protein
MYGYGRSGPTAGRSVERGSVAVRRSELVLARRALSVLAAATVALTLAPPAHAAESETVLFAYGTDRRSWWWEKQQDEEVTVPVPPGSPIEPSQRVRLPSPQRNDTLPVGVIQGDHERMSSVFIDLISRGVTEGSTINAFTLTIEESQDKNEQPSVEPGKAQIQGCRIDGFWPDSDGNEEWETLPKFSEKDCVQGKRDTKGKVPEWSFNLKPIADAWGQDPNKNYGVMLLGNLKNANDETTWQVNLKIPSRDNANTPDDEYKQTQKRLVVDLTFVPGELPGLAGEGFDSGSTGFTSSGSSFGSSTSFGSSGTSGFGTSGTSPVISTDTGDTSDESTAEEAPGAAPVATGQPATGPELPPYVWALLPIGLLALAAVRSVVLEPVGGTRPDGVIAAIRRRNAERRGGPLRELSDPLTRFVGASRQAFETARRGVRGLGQRISSAARSVRKR